MIMTRPEFEDKIVDLISEYIHNGEDVDASDPIEMDLSFEDDDYEVAALLNFEITKEK